MHVDINIFVGSKAAVIRWWSCNPVNEVVVNEPCSSVSLGIRIFLWNSRGRWTFFNISWSNTTHSTQSLFLLILITAAADQVEAVSNFFWISYHCVLNQALGCTQCRDLYFLQDRWINVHFWFFWILLYYTPASYKYIVQSARHGCRWRSRRCNETRQRHWLFQLLIRNR